MVEREREDRAQALLDRLIGEPREPDFLVDVWNRDRLSRCIRDKARAFCQVGLQLLEPKGGVVGGSDVLRVSAWRDQRDPSCTDRQHVDDAYDQVVQDGLDREVRHQSSRELAQHAGQSLISFQGGTPPQAAERADRRDPAVNHVLVYGTPSRGRVSRPQRRPQTCPAVSNMATDATV